MLYNRKLESCLEKVVGTKINKYINKNPLVFISGLISLKPVGCALKYANWF